MKKYYHEKYDGEDFKSSYEVEIAILDKLQNLDKIDNLDITLRDILKEVVDIKENGIKCECSNTNCDCDDDNTQGGDDNNGDNDNKNDDDKKEDDEKPKDDKTPDRDLTCEELSDLELLKTYQNLIKKIKREYEMMHTKDLPKERKPVVGLGYVRKPANKAVRNAARKGYQLYQTYDRNLYREW